MKRKFVFGLGIAALMASAPFVVSKPVLANLQEFGARSHSKSLSLK